MLLKLYIILLFIRPCAGRPSMLKDRNCNVCNIFSQKCMKATEIVGINDPRMAGKSNAKCRNDWECDYGHICNR